ncbi:MAG: hypothetical protein M1834_003073 [Cirrosporium novae-zelandiae]|nr:MAG: hypothetical protein M1834_003073 [Cirrosporium novae-zelandiae]
MSTPHHHQHQHTNSSRPSRPSSTLLPKPPIKADPTASLSTQTTLSGTHPITLYASSSISPRTRLTTLYAPITIGSRSTIFEHSSIGALSLGKVDGKGDDALAEGVVIAEDVEVRTAAVVEARSLGKGCLVCEGARLGKGVRISEDAVVGPAVRLKAGEDLEKGEVVCWIGGRRVRRWKGGFGE